MFSTTEGKMLTPRMMITSSTRPTTPPSSRAKVRPHSHGVASHLTRSPVR